MIRINLLTAEKPRAKPTSLAQVNLAGQKLTIACGLVLVAGIGLIGRQYWKLGEDSAQLNAQISQAQAETAQVQSVLLEVQQFEQRRVQLQERVSLIEQLRKDQTGPVHMLDEISKAMPPMLWLTDLKQSSAAGGEVVIDGRCLVLTALTDFVSNLERSGYFKKSIEIVNTQLEMSQSAADIIKFSIKAQFDRPANTAAGGAKPNPAN